MLIAEPLILARLQAALAAQDPPVRVCSSASVAGVLDIAAHCPLVLVHPVAASNVQRSVDNFVLEEVQTWKVVVVVKNIPDTREFASDYQAAGALAELVIRALAGWEPDAEFYKAMEYTERQETEVGSGFTEIPLVFETRYTLNNDPPAPLDSFLTANITHDLKLPVASGEPEGVDEVPLPQ